MLVKNTTTPIQISETQHNVTDKLQTLFSPKLSGASYAVLPLSHRCMLFYKNCLVFFDFHFSVQACSFTFLQTLIQFPAFPNCILFLLTNVWQLARGLLKVLSLELLVINQNVTRYKPFCLFPPSFTCVGKVTTESNLVKELAYVVDLLASRSGRQMGWVHEKDTNVTECDWDKHTCESLVGKKKIGVMK
jgi:hypothetical protein